jgi:hypothetical protein
MKSGSTAKAESAVGRERSPNRTPGISVTARAELGPAATFAWSGSVTRVPESKAPDCGRSGNQPARIDEHVVAALADTHTVAPVDFPIGGHRWMLVADEHVAPFDPAMSPELAAALWMIDITD